MGEKGHRMSKRVEVVLWSIALPGFGQLLNGKYLKGILFITLEILFNVMGNFNTVILLSFHLNIREATLEANYLWLMFYPCLYFFSIWDAYKDAGGGNDKPFAFLPLVFSAYFVTIGLILSPDFRIFGHVFGPMWLPIIFVPVGLGIGAFVRWILLKKYV